MLSVSDYRTRVLAQVNPCRVETRPLARARGCALAEDARSQVALPGFDSAAVDGYAVRAADVAAAGPRTPVKLPVDGDIPPGSRAPRSLAPGHVMRIITGAPLPAGADAVIPAEDTDGGTADVTSWHPVTPGQHVRFEGEDAGLGEVVLTAGELLGVRELTLAAAAGCWQVSVFARPKVLVLSTGDELVPPGSVPGFGEVVDSNGAMLAALLDAYGFEVARVTGVPDSPGAVLAAIAGGAAAGCDAVVSTGGVSVVGAYDVIKTALAGRGVIFDRVRMMPGMPQGFGVVTAESLRGAGPGPGAGTGAGPDCAPGVPVFTLPGSPFGAYVSFHLFVLPALQQMSGVRPAGLPVVTVRVTGEPPARQEREAYLCARLDAVDGELAATVLPSQDVHMLTGLRDADGLLVVPAADPARPGPGGGDRYQCLVLVDGLAAGAAGITWTRSCLERSGRTEAR